jgi:hypothetical protein
MLVRLCAALLLCVCSGVAGDRYLFTSFRKNGETGVYFALSRDGRRFTALKDNQPWLRPQREGMLMRDPWLGRGPDGTWHMLWTVGWTRKEAVGRLAFGHATSRDLIRWWSQEEITVLEQEPEARNVWAPEAVWNPQTAEWIIFWSTTIPGRFPETDKDGDGGYNHRIYATVTRDWKTFTPAKLWFDPGFSSIDATVVKDGNRYVMVFKDERKQPLQKRLRTAVADSPAGPWRSVSEPFTRDWVEGPTVARAGNEWWIYFDHYRSPQYVGAMKTADWRSFTDVSEQLEFPSDHRHARWSESRKMWRRRSRRFGRSAAGESSVARRSEAVEQAGSACPDKVLLAATARSMH